MRVVIPLLGLMLIGTAPAYAQVGASSGANSSVIVNSPAHTTNESTNRLVTPPTVVAPGLAAAGIETCLGSASGGVSVMGTGLTFGRTTPDEGCSIRLSARQLNAFGYPRAALALMCQDPRVAEAMATAGQACPSADFPVGETPPPAKAAPRTRKRVASGSPTRNTP